jgi:DNA helicase-2/ATP-dependent DNA helicase PcrA
MYVAITRAKEKLYLLNSEKRMLYGKLTVNMPSRFIGEINDNLLDVENKMKEQIKVNKSLLYDDEPSSDNDYKKGDLVNHISFGKGIVTDVDDRFVTIAFSYKIGTKKLLKNYKGIRKV